jgi:hypothetical protein
MECWNTGILEYWVLNASIHHSILPLFQSLVHESEAIERNEAYESFSSLNGTALSSEIQPRFCLFQMIFRKKDLRISLITHDLDLT